MELKLDTEKEYGIVLEGGGARGAYQIGAWRALSEIGIKIKGVSGTSVGALNGALICMGDLETAEQVWENISYSQVMDVDDTFMDGVIKRDFKNLELMDVFKNSMLYLKNGGIDVTPLKKLIVDHVDEKKLKERGIEFFFQIFSVTEMKELDIDASQLQEGQLADMILASAYFPVFKKEKVLGNKLIDAGMFNNVPMDSLIKRNYKDIISVRIYGIGLERKIKIPEDVTIWEIAPRVELGNILEFDKETSKRNMLIGYFDAVRMLYGLEGKIYYIDREIDERECLDLLFSIMKEESAWKNLLKCFHWNTESYPSPYRYLTEEIFPKIAADLKLSKNWNYVELYTAMLEGCAKLCRVPKYKIYTEKELLLEIKKRIDALLEDSKAEIPQFLEYVSLLKIS